MGRFYSVYLIGHQKRVGKDTTARLMSSILTRLGRNVLVKGFASKVKEICYEKYSIYGLENEDYYNQPENEHLRSVKLKYLDKTPRELWISEGMYGRSIDPNIWVNHLKTTFRSSGADTLIVPDFRFPDEEYEQWFKDARLTPNFGGCFLPVTIKIVNPNVPETEDVADVAAKAWKDWDYIIVNDGSLDSLELKVVNILKQQYKDIYDFSLIRKDA